MTKPKLKIVKRSVKHTFTPEEIANLNVDFRQAFANLRSVEAEFDSVKASYKAKTTEAESRMETLNATLQAGFELRDKPCVRILDIPAGKKHYYLEGDVDPVSGAPYLGKESAITESLTEEDKQQDLIEKEAAFEAREDIILFPQAGLDAGILKIGRQGGKWFTALCVTIGKNTVTERLDGEQQATKKRPEAVKRGVKRFVEWVSANLGAEESKGFANQANLVIVEHAEREE